MHIWIRRLAVSVASVMFLIIVMGALVTKTDSGLGCGYEWPLCNGKFVPAYTISSMIEYSHRAVVGIFTILLLITTILVFMKSSRKDAKWLCVGAIFFTLLQAVLGAFAVVIPQSAPILALHFGLSLLAFSFCFLLAVVYSKWGGIKQIDASSSLNKNPNHARRRNMITTTHRWLIGGILAYTYVVVYLGAFVRHTNSSGGCSGWPLCNGEIVPDLSGATGIVFIHRIGALVLSIAIIVWFVMIRRKFDATHPVSQASLWVVVWLGLQVISGAVVTHSIGSETYYLLAAMVHAVLVTLLFAFLSYIGFLTFRKNIKSDEIRVSIDGG